MTQVELTELSQGEVELDYRVDSENSGNEVTESSYLREIEENRGPEVFVDLNQPIEAPAKEFVAGEYYRDAEEIVPELAAQAEGPEADAPKLNVDRRDFMRLFSASSVFAATACVRRPVEKVIPYVTQPIDQVPGTPTYYASTCGECSSACGVVVKTREGRPVKIEGNSENPISQGATCALGQSTLQALYHPERRKMPRMNAGSGMADAEWNDWFKAVAEKINGKSNVGILTGAATGHRHDFFRRFLKHIGSPDTNLFTYDANMLLASTIEAHRIAFGVEAMPRTELRKAELIVGIGSDFLEVGTSPVYSAKNFAEAHTFKFEKMGRFVAFESALSQTGGRANERHVMAAGHEIVATLLLVKHLFAQSNAKGAASEREEIKRVLDANAAILEGAYDKVGMDSAGFDALAADMLKSPSCVLAGGSYGFDENATTLQLAAIMANVLCGAYGETMYIDRGWMTAPVRPGDMKRFMNEASKLDALFIIETNPSFSIPATWGFDTLVKQIPTVVSMQSMPCETDEVAQFQGNVHHYLESWGDEQPVAGFWSARQPAVRAAFGSRQSEDVLMWVAASMNKPMGYSEYRDFVKEQWKTIHQVLAAQVAYDTFFDAVLRRGFSGRLDKQTVRSMSGVAGAFSFSKPVEGSTVLVTNLDARLREGRGADRPVLHEVGDAMTSICWDTWVAMNPKRAAKEGFKKMDVVKVTTSAGSFEAAVYPLPGLHYNTIAVPRGNGRRKGILKTTDGIGVDPLVVLNKREDKLSGQPATSCEVVEIAKTGKQFALAWTQKTTDIGNRKDIIKQVSLKSAQETRNEAVDLDTVPDLYPVLDKEAQYRWGMTIDLTACTGCSACMVACATENNIPTIGRTEIRRGREMHWIRLDRYYKGDLDNPEVTFQPVMCQQCNHAPCEAVCPVYATTHDPEGINSQTYNRCVGTRYCANACPYKVRRFNWFQHKWNVIGDREMDKNPRALNPDVSIRTRGVMEKCTFCIQRIREAKHTAIEQGGKVTDAMLMTACQQVCPSNAITFGDLKNPRSNAAKARKDARAFLMLGGDPKHKHYGIKTLPNVSYLAKVVHKEVEASHGHHDSDHHG